MPRFPSTAAAAEWAMELLSIHSGGRSNAGGSGAGGGSIGKDYARLDAIQIRNAADEACRCGLQCIHPRSDCLFHWHVPDPLIKHLPMSLGQEQLIQRCDATFREILWRKGFLG